MNEKTKSHRRVLLLCEGAIMVVLAQILGYIKVWEMPWGGSVCLSMLPIICYACRWGVGAGLMSGFVLGVLQFMYDGGFALGWQSIIGDYLLAFTVLGLAGLCRGKVYWGSLLAGVARFGVHYVVGATIWAEYMPEEFFGMTMGLSSDAGVAVGTSCTAMMMTTPYGIYMVTLEDGADAQAIAADFEANLNWQKFVCVTPTNAVIAQKDNMVLCFMGSDELYTQTAAAIEAAGWKVVKELECPKE